MRSPVPHNIDAGGLAFAAGLRRRLIGLVVVLGGGLFMLLVATLAWFTFDQDRQAAAMSRHIAASAIAARVEFMDRALTQYAIWDDPIEHVLLHRDHRWMDETIGPYVFDQLHVEQSYVITADGRLLYAMRNRRSGRAEQTIDASLKRLAVAVARQPGSKPMGQVALVDGRPAIVGLQKLAPSTARFAALGDTRTAIVFVDFLDDATVMRDIGATYALAGLRMRRNAENNVSAGSIALLNGSGEAIGWLAWEQYQPGRNTLHQLAPIVIMLVLAVAYAAVGIGGTVKSMVQQALADRALAGDALVRARVALEAAQASRGDAERVRQQLREVEDAHLELAALRGRTRYAA